jgi:hypothetical protein
VLVQPYLGPVIVALLIVVALLLIAVSGLVRRTRRIEARVTGLVGGEATGPAAAGGDGTPDRVDAVARDLEALTARTAALETAQRRTFQRVGLVRYNPFEDTGGNQSFALALLDAAGDGWVLSSLHARSGTRVYAKGITAGRSDAGLSDEETAAITQAMA